MKVVFLGLNVTLPMMFDPGLPALHWNRAISGTQGPIPIELPSPGATKDDPRLTFDVERVLIILSSPCWK
jgi:hypothetical protein